MKISYFNYLWDIEGISAGSAIKGIEFVEGLRRQGYDVTLEWRTPQPHKSNNNQSVIKKNTHALIQKYLRESKRYLVNIKHLIQEYILLKQNKPDIIFSRLEYGIFSCVLLSKWFNIPLVIEADCPPTHEWVNFYARDAFKLGNLSLKLEVAVLKQADAVITQSNQLTDYYVNLGIQREKIHMITNAANIQKYKNMEPNLDFRAKYKLKDKIVIGWVGAGVGWTGIEVLNKTMHQLMKEYPSVTFLMIGSQENMDFFREHFHKDGDADRFILAGFVPHEDIPKYLSCMDIVLAPYPKFDFFYASSMKLFEYMAAGKAIVATRVGQIAEVIKEGENGYLFDPEIPGELYQKVSKLVSSEKLRKRLGQSARIDSQREWNWDRVAEKMSTVFEEVLVKR